MIVGGTKAVWNKLETVGKRDGKDGVTSLSGTRRGSKRFETDPLANLNEHASQHRRHEHTSDTIHRPSNSLPEFPRLPVERPVDEEDSCRNLEEYSESGDTSKLIPPRWSRIGLIRHNRKQCRSNLEARVSSKRGSAEAKHSVTSFILTRITYDLCNRTMPLCKTLCS